MTVAELKAAIEGLPDNTTVRIYHETPSGGASDEAEFVAFSWGYIELIPHSLIEGEPKE